MKKPTDAPPGQGRPVLHIDLFGAILLSLALVAAASVVTYVFSRSAHYGNKRSPASHDAEGGGMSPSTDTPPWGELITYDIRLEQPEEYLAFELDHLRPPVWIFEGMTPDQARQTMVASGLTAAQAGQALAPGKVSV